MRAALWVRIINLSLGAMTAVTFLVLYAPVFVSAVFSILPSSSQGSPDEGVTLRWYAQMIHDPSVMQAVGTTLIVGVIAVAAATGLSLILALYTAWEGAMCRGLVELVVYLPFLMPPIITGMSLLIFFNRLGVRRGILTIVVGHTVLVLAVLYRIVQIRLRSIPSSMVEASADLGATGLQTFRFVLWPQLRSAVATGAVLAATISFDETFITVFLSGDTTTLPLRLWGMMRVGFTPEVNALVTVVLFVSIAFALLAAKRLTPKGELQKI